MNRRRFLKYLGAAALALGCPDAFADLPKTDNRTALLKGLRIIDAHAHPERYLSEGQYAENSSTVKAMTEMGMAASIFAAVGDRVFLSGGRLPGTEYRQHENPTRSLDERNRPHRQGETRPESLRHPTGPGAGRHSGMHPRHRGRRRAGGQSGPGERVLRIRREDDHAHPLQQQPPRRLHAGPRKPRFQAAQRRPHGGGAQGDREDAGAGHGRRRRPTPTRARSGRSAKSPGGRWWIPTATPARWPTQTNAGASAPGRTWRRWQKRGASSAPGRGE